MILWFLRLFNQFRLFEYALDLANRDYEKQSEHKLHAEMDRDSLKTDLTFCRSRLQEVETENLRLQDRVEAANEDRKQLWEMLREALGNERDALMMQINADWQKRYGVIPHPDAPSIPEKFSNAVEAVTDFGRQGRLLPSEMVANATNKFWENRQKRQAEIQQEAAVHPNGTSE